MLKNKKLLVGLGIAGALLLVLGGVGFAYAQGPEPPMDDQFFHYRGSFGGGIPGGLAGGVPMRGGPFHGRGEHSLVEVTAEVTGLGEDEVIAALEDGQTFAEIADGAGVDPQGIVDAAIAAAEAELEGAVEDGRMTEEQMAQILERLAEDLPDRLEQSWQPRGAAAGGIFGQFNEGFWTMYDAVAEVLGLAPEGLFTELHDGKSVAEVAEEQGVEMEVVRDAMEESRIEARKQALEQAVENGRLTQEQADWMIEGLERGFMPNGHSFDQGRGARPRPGERGRGMGW